MIFTAVYDRVLTWAAHRHAARYLIGLSFMESSFFPIPPDVMLIPMVLRAPTQAWRLAGFTTLASVLGGLLGYLIGYFAFMQLAPWLQSLGYWLQYQQIVAWFGEWGVWIIFLAGFTPIPYKLFTIAAGALHLALIPFVVASLIGRGARFYLVALLVAVIGPRVETRIRRYIEYLGWATVVLLITLYFLLK